MHAVSERGLFTGNRGCLVDEDGGVVRHHRGSLWITCRTQFRGWRHPLESPGTWTPLFFLDDAVALAAGHRPCGLCRRADYRSYVSAVSLAVGADATLSAQDLNRRLSRERLRRGRGLRRTADRIVWSARLETLPSGTVVVDPVDRRAMLLSGDGVHRFGFGGWGPATVTADGAVEVLTPPTSVAALGHGYTPVLHESAITAAGR